MRLPLNSGRARWAALAALLAIASGAGYLAWTRELFATATPAELAACLPTGNAAVLYIDVDALRRSGLLRLIAGSNAAAELEYEQFVRKTQFDYRQDLDAVAAAFKDDQVFLAARGRFHWKPLMDYAASQGGGCRNGFCTLTGSAPERRISFYALKPNLIGMAVSRDDLAAYQVTRKAGSLAIAPPAEPLWMVVPALALNRAEALPAGAKAYASALRNAEQIVFSAGPAAAGEDGLLLSLRVSCKDAESASALLVDLENTTNTLRKWIAREGAASNPADLSGVLTAGTFRRDERVVYGQWPLRKAFIEALAGASY